MYQEKMKKNKKIILRILVIVFLSGFLIIVISVFSFYYYLRHSIDDVLTEEQQQVMYNAIDTTPRLPEKFYSTIEKYYPGYFERTMTSTLIHNILFKNNEYCACAEIYNGMSMLQANPNQTKFSRNFGSWIIKFEIEKHYSQKRCLDYLLHTESFGSNTRNIEQAASKLYNKDLEVLTEREILELFVIKNTPTYYSPTKNPENLKNKVDEIISKNQ